MADLRLRKRELQVHGSSGRPALELGDAAFDAGLERAVARPELDLRLLEEVDCPDKVEPDHVGLVAAALTYP